MSLPTTVVVPGQEEKEHRGAGGDGPAVRHKEIHPGTISSNAFYPQHIGLFLLKLCINLAPMIANIVVSGVIKTQFRDFKTSKTLTSRDLLLF